ncbi:MAG TPA: NAD(P)-dependent oxidoreductase [Burkholderiales bacterium]|nr:NAD(P)-dependent oxidoreductase [Burkholderiales bacterium]
MKIGVAGIGRMGAAIAERLLATGETVYVWNRTAAKARALEALGAQAVGTPGELTLAADVVLTILTDDEAIRATYLGEHGLLSVDARGKVFIEMSTARASVQRELAGEVRRRGARFAEAPVGGTVGPAREGKLIAFVGGGTDDFLSAKPVLDRLCRRIEHVGDVGAGAAMKLAANLPMHVYWTALREALVLCEPLDLDPARLIDIMADTSGAPQSLRARAAAIVQALRGEDAPAPAFDIDGIRKDLALMIEEAPAPLPVTRQALTCFDEAARQGYGAESAAALLRNRR